MSSHQLDLASLIGLPALDRESGVAVSPDGRCAAFGRNPDGAWRIYLLDLEQPNAPAQCITPGAGAYFRPRWSPDGRWLAYLHDLDGGENYDLWLMELQTHQQHLLTPQTPFALQPTYDWSPDSQRLVVLAEPEGMFQPFILDRTQGWREDHALMAELPFLASDVSWSPSGEWLAVITEARGQDHQLFLVHAQSGEVRPVLGPGALPWLVQACAWSPDGQRLALTVPRGEHIQAAFYDLRTSRLTRLDDLPFDLDSPDWSPDGRRLVFTAQFGASNHLLVVDLETGQYGQHKIGSGIHHTPRWAPDGQVVDLVFESPHTPPDAWRVHLDGRASQITHTDAAGLELEQLIPPQEITYPALDGRQVPALLYQPRQVKQSGPAVIYLHGGPNWLAQIEWMPFIQHMLSRGWTVLAPNYCGSIHYGRTWQLANRFDLGGGDSDDVAAAARFLVEKHLAAPDRIAVTGRSYGGYLTLSVMTRFPELWAAGSAVAPFLNWFTAHANSRPDLQHWDLENFGHPQTDAALYQERSPFFYLDRLQAPLQLISGAHDPRCPASESIQAQQALQALDKPCELLLYPDEGHVFHQKRNRVDHLLRCEAFLARSLE